MTTPFEIPLSAQPQRFTISLVGVVYQITMKWNRISQCWIVDIADSTGNALVSGLPMITGADLLEQFHYLRIGGSVIAQTDHDTDAVPTFTNLGTTSHLYFVT